MFRVVAYGADCVEAFTGRWTSDPDALAHDAEDARGAATWQIHVERRPDGASTEATLVAAGMDGRGATVPRFLEGLRSTPPRYPSDWW